MIQKIEDKMKSVLIGDALKNALDFAEYLQANEFAVNDHEVSYKGKAVCYMHIAEGEDYPCPWTIWSEGNYSVENPEIPLGEGMKEIAWANVNKCSSCGGDCAPGKRGAIFGKEFDSLCNAVMAFYIPNAEVLECVKKLLDMRKNEFMETNKVS